MVKPEKTAGLRRRLLLLGGHVLLGLGLVGAMLPVLPTTIFWIGAAACYAKSSPERYRRLIARGRSGKAVGAFLDHGVIAPAGKMAALFGMSLAALIILATPLGTVTTVFALLLLLVGAIYVATRPNAAPTHSVTPSQPAATLRR